VRLSWQWRVVISESAEVVVVHALLDGRALQIYC
jgi:hypothetical protein